MIRLFGIVVMLCAFSASGADLPPRVEVSYDVSWNGLTIGKADDHFEHDGKQFTIVSDTKTVGLAAALHKMSIRREVHGTITNAGLQSGTFSEERTKKAPKSAKFDWIKKQVILDSGQGPQTVPLPDYPTFDQSTFAWSFAFNPPNNKEGKVALTDGRKLSEYRFAMIGRDKLTTPLGEMDTIHMKKIQDKDDKRGFEVWLAAQKNFLPVRILFTDDGDTVDSVVTNLTFPAKP